MTERQTPIRTMRAQMAIVVLIAILLGILTFFGAQALGGWAVDRWYLSEQAVRARSDAVAENLQRYVTDNAVDGGDAEAVHRWAATRREVSVVVFHPAQLYQADSYGYEYLYHRQQLRLELPGQGYAFYTIAFADGDVDVAVLENSEITLLDLIAYVSLGLAFLVLLLATLVYSRRVAERISRLSAEVNAVSQGDLDGSIHTEGRDELARLAQDVDHMRGTIIQRVQSEQNALRANSELITALSHDIRNPLTALIGYLELIDMDRTSLPEADRDYLRASLEKSYRIRDLTGEMFRYFLVFSKEAQSVAFESYDAQTLLWQLLGECAVDLQSQGFQVQTNALEGEYTLCTDVNLLKRVVDNLVSNVEKYADADSPVRIEAEAESGVLTIRFANRVAPLRPGTVESNRVGLRTCGAIMRLLGGSFSVRTETDTFTAECAMPVQPGTPQ